MRTIEQLGIIVREKKKLGTASYQETKISPQAAMVCEAVDKQLDALRREFDEKLKRAGMTPPPSGGT
ncbi:hypothetical protein [Tautonia plasticadhaerens]|uniref:Uncharacterized protein n=1 Tax=Tautonia plasticadhaerens TaxID=2527974 RepID=A0A518H293_9BACT|nr:hypothetical protein [Tautonia plasticadhaerens]QDV34930.1 hypothetical protein ElP_28270 [Tautonia plasticadhaerens]